jgi:hypothetical protein
VRNWQTSVLTSREDRIEITEFGLHCAVEDLYRGTPLVPGRA